MGLDERDKIKIFAGRHCIDLAKKICDRLDMPLGAARTEVFPDGELITYIDEDVRGRDCFVVLSTCEPVNENVMELLIFADSLRRASAKRLTAVIPYYGYGRQDRKERGRTPITAKLIANMVTNAGFDRVLALDLHAAQIQGFFDIPVDHLSASPVLYRYFEEYRDTMGDIVVVSPDVGNVKVANEYADLLNVDLAIIDKRRHSADNVEFANIVGDVKGRVVLMVDDIISTAGTVCSAANVVMEHGATDVIVATTHAVLSGPAVERLQSSPISRMIVTNTIPRHTLAQKEIPSRDRFDGIQDRITTLCVSGLFADAIHHIHHNLSVSSLFRQFAGSKR